MVSSKKVKIRTGARNRKKYYIKNKRSTSSLFESRMDTKHFFKKTTTSEREHLRKALNETIKRFLSLEQSVYLESLGILFISLTEQTSAHRHQEQIALRKDQRLKVCFEKCSELIPYQREKHPAVVETAELTQHLYVLLPIEMQIKYTERTTRKLIKGLIQSIRTEVVVDGFSGQISSIGNLFALHNRQGAGIDDWFAGSDIFIADKLNMLKRVSIQSKFCQPTLNNAWELFEACYGEPLTRFSLNLAEELESLGYDREFFQANYTESEAYVNVAAFLQADHPSSSRSTILLSTDGIRYQTSTETELPCEFVFQLEATELAEGNTKSIAAQTLTVAKKAMTLAWILHQSFRKKSLSAGMGMGTETVLSKSHPESKDGITGIFLTPFSKVTYPQKCEGGDFQYLNVVGVTEDELRFSESRSPEHLTSLLQYKNMDQVTAPQRRSIFHRSNRASQDRKPSAGRMKHSETTQKFSKTTISQANV